MTRLTGQPPFLAAAALASLLSLAACDGTGNNGNDSTADRVSQKDGKPTQAQSSDDTVRPVPKKLTHQTETLERRPDGCEGDDCPIFEARWQVYQGQPELNAAVRRQLISQLATGGEKPTAADSLDVAAERFLASAAEVPAPNGRGWELSGDAKQVGRWRDLVTIAVSSYEFTGGAHGMPVTRWLNWDLAENRAVPLGRVIESGREDAFWTAAASAHGRWVDEQAPDDDTFREDWPFQQSDTYRLTDDGVILHYDVYSIAPYAMGQPELTVPWSDLEDVVRARYRPE